LKKPFIIGLTGSIGMGKTTTAEMFREQGIPVWSADDAVHRLYGPEGLAVAAIASLCPEAVSTAGVDRAVLSKWITETRDGLSKIEAVIHPLVAEDRARFLQATTEDVVVLDIPLLFETGGDKFVDAVVVVSVSENEQRKRVLARPGMTAEKLDFILSKQLPDLEKRKRADFVIETSSLDDARLAVQKVIESIQGIKDHA
jgi:dephospho-CoA kinase